MEALVNSSKASFASSFWHGRRVLVTGHTGFKGAWLAIWLNRLSAITCGYSLAPEQKPNLFEAAQVAGLCQHNVGDITDPHHLSRVIEQFQPEVVFHLAAQALVRKSYSEPIETFSANVMGTAYLLNELRSSKSVRAIVAITTDKVYRNNEEGRAFAEQDPLGGHDPYSASKAAAEFVIESYRRSFFSNLDIGLVSARAGNVIGGGDWSQDRLIPDAIRAWNAGQVLTLRNPTAVRPWQHVVEPLHAYMIAAQQIFQTPSLSDSFNFGPAAQSMISVGDVIRLAAQYMPAARHQITASSEQPHEAQLLHLDVSKASRILGIDPVWDVGVAVERTMQWFASYERAPNSARMSCLNDIDDFMQACESS
ncbi:MAG: CDP-glucose 4,6-dehydratase [Brachymonas sp.]|nr:CDP-glucose 4,6-dehydratase [Brachymonas sp.]